MPPGLARVIVCLAAFVALAAAAASVPLLPARAEVMRATPDLASATAYLVSSANLVDGHYYQSIAPYADFGLTIDGALALAATADQDAALRRIVAFLDAGGKDAAGKTVNDWTGIGTRFAAGGPIGKEALLAEVVGANPRRFGGHDLIAALDAAVCQRPGAGGRARCPGTGSFTYASSVFDQALGVLALLRAGQPAVAPVSYLEGLRYPDGAFPSLVPRGGGSDVDSTAMAAMALVLAHGARAAADVAAGLAWIAGRQEHDGGFPGAGGDSVNSAALAIQALSLRAARYRAQITAARAFLASEQNGDGGFNAAVGGQRGSNLRASAQAVSGAVGVPYGTLRVSLDRAVRKQAGALPVRDCTARSGVLLVVDFGHWGGPLLRACGATPTSGFALLNEGGWHTTGTDHDGPGFICRIGYVGFRHGAQLPTTRQDACVLTPPAGAYWALWRAGPGQDSWTYSQTGALAYRPAPGSIELWLFGGTTVGGSAGSAVPTFSPGQLRSGTGLRALLDAEPVRRGAPASGGSYAPTLIAVALVAVIAAAGAISVRRRARRP